MDCSLSCNSSFDDLPDGLVVDILKRLPVKIIIQSTCVCKLWYSIIKTPSFVSSHLSRSISDPSRYYSYLFRYYSPSMVIVSDNHLLTRHTDFVFPFEIELTSFQLFGTCNGLVCAAKDSRDIYLINPFIGKYKKLVFESSCYADWINKFHHRLVGIKVGFCYSEVENDYKVVRTINRFPYTPRDTLGDLGYERVGLGSYPYASKAIRDELGHERLSLESKVEIYSLKSGKWKSVEISFELTSHHSPVLVHGCLYWSVYQFLGPDKYLLCFDVNNEVFSRIEFPTTYLQLHSTLARNILIKNGSFAVVVYKNDLDSICPCMRIYIFVLEKNVGGQVRWKELYYECANFNVWTCIGFSGVGRLLFVESNSDFETNYIVAVDLDNSCAIEKLAVDSTDITHGVTNVMESLVLLLD